MHDDTSRVRSPDPSASDAPRFRLLGPVEVDLDGTSAMLGRRRERSLLAILLLEIDKEISAERLIDLLWDGTPPLAARSALHSHMSRLRSVVDPARDGRYGIRLQVGSSGYHAEVDPDQVDVHRFAQLFSQSRVVPDPGARAAGLRAALALWRGPALAGTASDMMRRRILTDLAEQRLEAVRLAIDAELECGRHREVIGELAALTTEHPEREEPWAQLALALYRCDRPTEALSALARAREHVVGELGIDPGAHLQELHGQILRADPVLQPPTTRADHVESHSLPMDITDFTGRDAELARLHTIARPTGQGEVVICAIEGMAGVGKTKLAIHAAHTFRREGRFDEIQLWVDLRGFHRDKDPLEPTTVLSNFLRLLGVPLHEIPDDAETRAALYRDRLSGRRALVVLDNAADEDQVRPLLPGDPGCLVLITSRRSLTCLDGVQALPLDVFDPRESLALLERHAGRRRTQAEPAAARRLGELCGHLPMAVASTARHLRARPGSRLENLVERLEAGASPLAATAHTRAVQTAFALSYRALQPTAARLFRLAAHHPGEDFAAPSVAALAGLEPAVAESTLDTLVNEHMVLETPVGRLGMHTLVRQYAAARGEELDPAEDRYAAMVRLTTHYVDLATKATLAVYPTETRRIMTPSGPGWDTPAAAIRWVEGEYTNLVATAYHAAEGEGELPRLALRLLAALYRPLANRGHSSDRIALNRLAVRTARRLRDRSAEALAWEDLGTLIAEVDASADAADCLERGLAVWTELGHHVGKQACLATLGNLHRQRGRHAEAVEHLQRSVALAEESGRASGAASALNYLGLTHQATGHFKGAVRCLKHSASLYREVGSRLGEAIAVANLGWAYQRAGEPAAAIPLHERGRAMFRDLGDIYNEAEQDWGLGQAHHVLGRTGPARTRWTAAIEKLHGIDMLDEKAAVRMLAQDVPDTPEVIRINT